MTTGLPLYLVSACDTAEEFVAAFRRYADRTGLFIPAASPLPAGRRGRLALTLKDGGVMIEGEAEILQSSVKPTVLHGRPGMTVKFVEPDEPSKTVIGELEKARLALKPAPPSVAPRPAAIPAEPRPVPPAPSGRIDATNALAECVVIGDPAVLRETAGPRAHSDSKFTVPAIPPAGSPRPKTPSAAPPPPAVKPPSVERTKAPTVPPDPAATKLPMPSAMPKPPANSKHTSIGFPIVDKMPARDFGLAEPVPIVSNATTLGMPALDRKPDVSLADTKIGTAAPINPTPTSLPAQDDKTSIGTSELVETKPYEQVAEEDATAISSPPIKKPTDPMPAAVPLATPADPLSPKRTESAKHHKATSIGFPALRTPFETQALRTVPGSSPSKFDPQEPSPPTLPKNPRATQAPSPRGKTPTTPPLTPRHPTPVAPVPIVRSPAKAVPTPPPDQEPTDIGSDLQVATAPTEPMSSVDSGAIAKPAQRSGGMRASEILAAIPAGDWTMTPDESVPHALPSDEKLPAMGASEPTPAPAPPPVPSGDWLMSLDPETGWSEPEKVEAGNPVHAVASDKPINVQQWDEKPTGIGESKIEVDSSLMEQRRASSSDDEPARIVDTKPTDVPPPHASLPPRVGGPPRTKKASTAPPAYPTRPSSTDMMGYGAAPMPRMPKSASKTKMIALAVIAGAVAVGAIVMLVLTLGGAKKAAPPTSSGSADSIAQPTTPAPVEPPPPPPAGSGSAQVAVAEPAGSASETKPAPAAVDVATPEVEPAKPVATTCKVDIKSIPAGAEIFVDKQKLGTAPKTIELPCGSETKLTLKKKSFPTTPRLITPVADKPNKLVVKLAKTLFSVKVTSTPAGATITTGGRSVGVTPTTIKLPAYETSAVTLKKPGYSTDTQRVSPKQNNTSHHVTLKKGR